MPKPKSKRSTAQAGSTHPTGSDPILELMRESGLPLTRQSYAEFNFQDAPKPLPAELEAQIPKSLK